MIATTPQSENVPCYDTDAEAQKRERELHFKASLAVQASEVFENAYYLSKRVHHDVNVRESISDWIYTPIPAPGEVGASTQAAEFRKRFERNWSDIEKVCMQECHGECFGIKGCKLPLYRIHELLKD